jgi:hypothetical protein
LAGERLSIEETAAAWLAAERAAIALDNTPNAERQARTLSAEYDDAIRSASTEELLLAWESARRNQGQQEMGSARWLEARSISELLRREYQASRGEG